MQFIAVAILILNIILLGNSSESAYGWEQATARYQSPEGILFQSDSPNWDEKKLKALYHELLLNGHGNEIQTLTAVMVYDKPDKEASGRYYVDQRKIELYDGRDLKTVNELSNTLSHEYGHHFMYTYFSDAESRLSKWAQLRDNPHYRINWNDHKGSNDHKWQPAEIFADDYVFFYGSQNVKPFHCTREKIDDCVAVMHENAYLVHPSEVPELREYLAKKSGITPSSPENFPIPRVKEVRGITETSFNNKEYHPLVTVDMPSDDDRYVYSMNYYDEHFDEVTYYNLQPKLPLVKDISYGITLFDDEDISDHLQFNIDILDLHTRNLIHTPVYSFPFNALKNTSKSIPNAYWVQREE